MPMEQFLLTVSINKQCEVYDNWQKELERFVITIKTRRRWQTISKSTYDCKSRLLAYSFDYSTSTTYRGIKCKSLYSVRHEHPRVAYARKPMFQRQWRQLQFSIYLDIDILFKVAFIRKQVKSRYFSDVYSFTNNRVF